MTKSYKRKYIICVIISTLLTVGPAIFYIVKAFINDVAVERKLALSMSLLAVLLLTAIAAVNKMLIRSRLWILIIGLYFCLDNIAYTLVVIGTCQIVDELILTPLTTYYKNAYQINKQIDKRTP